MPVKTRFLLSVTAITLMAGCSRAPELRPRLILQGEPVGDDFWLAAPYVLAVKITRADWDGSPQAVFSGGPKTLQLAKFEADVENVIKGDLPPGKAITFFFFVKLDQNPQYYLDPGKRYIISLRREGGLLRSWADASQLRIEIQSGFHNQKDLPVNLGPRTTIAYVLLTPGQDCDLHEFANRLGWPPLTPTDPGYVYQRLRQLQLSSNLEVRDRACLTAASMFWYRPPCLNQATHDPEADIRSAASKRLSEDDANLPGLLQRKPFPLFPRPWTDSMTETFEIYTEDSRPQVRKAACDFLRSFAPDRAVDHCH